MRAFQKMPGHRIGMSHGFEAENVRAENIIDEALRVVQVPWWPPPTYKKYVMEIAPKLTRHLLPASIIVLLWSWYVI